MANLEELRHFVDMLAEVGGFGVANDAKADNRDWLD